MPYIDLEHRIALDAIVDGLVKRLRDINCKPGDCNYVVTRVVLEALKPHDGWRYHSLSDAVRVLKDAAAEIERRLLGPYEDRVILQNGDMPCFQESFAKHPTAYEQIWKNGKYRSRTHPRRTSTRPVEEILKKGLADAFAKRKPEDSPYLQKLAEEAEEAKKVEGIADRVPEFNDGSEEKREAFERLCKERTLRLKNLNDGLQRIIDGDTPPPESEETNETE